jgi:hypothetical protein
MWLLWTRNISGPNKISGPLKFPAPENFSFLGLKFHIPSSSHFRHSLAKLSQVDERPRTIYFWTTTILQVNGKVIARICWVLKPPQKRKTSSGKSSQAEVLSC